MPANPFSPVLQSIRQKFGLDAFGESPDALLLERFVLADDQSAFAALVERHGALVWGVCRRVTGNAHVAEDAFQATWIVLARKARSVKTGGSLPGWLHRVAFRLSLAARVRPAAPLEDAPVEAPGPEDEAVLKELGRAIDEEVSRLPEKYRLPVVLCFLEGRTHAEAAAELGWPVGTVAGRVARAKDLLHARLTRRGLAPAAWPLPLAAAGAFPPVAGKAAGSVAAALAEALLAGEAQRRLVVGGAILLLLCVGAAAGLAYSSGSGWVGPVHPVPRVGTPALAMRIPGTRIAPVDEGGAFALDLGGNLLAANSRGSVRLFDVRSNREVAALPGQKPTSLLFSRDGKWLAGARLVEGPDARSPRRETRSVEIQVWDLASRQVRPLCGEPLTDLGEIRLFLADFDPAGDTLTVALEIGDDRRNETQLWSVSSGKRLKSFAGMFGAVSQDRKTLATYDKKTQVTSLWELPSGKQLPDLHPGGVPAFHPKGEILATFNPDDLIIRLWDRKTGLRSTLDPLIAFYQVSSLSGRDAMRTGLIEQTHEAFADFRKTGRHFFHEWGPPPLFSRDGEVLACSCGKDTLLWSVRKKEVLGRLKGAHVPYAFSPDGVRLASASGLWEVASCEQLTEREGSRVLFGSDSKTYFTHSGSAIKVWDVQTGREQGALEGYLGDPLAFSLDGKVLVSVNVPPRDAVPPAKPSVTVWDLTAGIKPEVFDNPVVDPDGKRVTFGKGRTIRLSSPLVPSLRVPSPDGKTFAFIPTPRFDRPPRPARDEGKDADEMSQPPWVDLPGGGKHLDNHEEARELFGGVQLRDQPSLKMRGTLAGHTLKWFDRNDRPCQDGQLRGIWPAVPKAVRAVAFSPDGKTLATGGYDGTILLWDVSQ